MIPTQGDDGIKWFADCWKLDTKAWTWEKVWDGGDRLTRSSHTCNVVKDTDGKDMIILFGGSTDREHLNDVVTMKFRGEIGSSRLDVFSRATAGDVPSQRSCASAVVVDGK